MGVALRHLNVGVVQRLLDEIQVVPGLRAEAGEGVSKVMDADAFQACRVHQLIQALARINNMPAGIASRKHPRTSCVISSIGTTNYNNLIEKVVTTTQAIHLNGNVDDYYDPYSNKIQTLNADQLKDQDRILVPFIFTQSGIKPLTSVEMSRKYVKLFDEYKDSDTIVVVGFAFNGDDGHINGLFRELLDEHGKKIVVICLKGDKTDDELKKDYRRRLRAKTSEGLHVVQVDPESRSTPAGMLWLDAVVALSQ